jgi:hypothetical protein
MARTPTLGAIALALCLFASAASGEAALHSHWSFTPAVTPAFPLASLNTETGPIAATGFALGLTGTDLFRDGDALTFTFAQPPRAMRASAMLMTGVARDWTASGIVMGEAHPSLLPSGREFDVRTGYRFAMGPWSAQANIAYAVDPDHLRGGNTMLTLFSLTRMF